MITDEIFESIRSKILLVLKNNLLHDLLYHSVEHTIDVERQAERIAINEGLFVKNDLLLLKTACLYHDSGFLFTYRDHEAAGCKLARQELPAFGLTIKEVEVVCGLIMATKIPQTPLSKLEEVICDADLDYLGRDDFFPISNNLFQEMKARNLVDSEKVWNQIQVNFFKQHHYFTATTISLREQKKLAHLKMIEEMRYNEDRVV